MNINWERRRQDMGMLQGASRHCEALRFAISHLPAGRYLKELKMPSIPGQKNHSPKNRHYPD